MKLSLIFFFKKKKKIPFLSTKILAGAYFCESSKLKRFAGTYFCKFGENLQNSQKFPTIRYTESWCDITTQIEHVIS